MDLKIKSSWLTAAFKVLAWVLIFLGAAIRLIVYIQNRNLFTDEANVARNIYERSFATLALPLNYEQYAATVFLWLLKISALVLGYGELALRLVPLLSGIVALYLLYLISKRLGSVRSAWYAVGLMAVSFYMIRYSTELKQYTTDVLVVLSMTLLALAVNLKNKSPRSFFIIWACAGTLAIWSAMPSVFVLAAIGAYYLPQSIRNKNRQQLLTIISLGIFWLAQFGIYYWFILKSQIESGYLQNFHNEYFLFALPKNAAQWEHNWLLLKTLYQEAAGFSMYYTYINGALFLIGIIALCIKQPSRALLIAIPLLAVVIAAALRQFTLIPRVALFTMPLILLVISYGLEQLMHTRWLVVTVVFICVGIKGIYGHSSVRAMIEKPFTVNEIIQSMHFLTANKIDGAQLYVNHGGVPAFIYYTQMHPQRSKWESLKDAKFLEWYSSYQEVAMAEKDTIALLATSVTEEELKMKRDSVEQHRQVAAEFSGDGSNAVIYTRKN